MRCNHLTEREQVILFFVKHSKNKLNKNHYNINFYKKRNSVHIHSTLERYFFDIPELQNSSIALKYYHIFNLNAPLQDKELFINFSKGYGGDNHQKQPVERDLVKLVPVSACYTLEKTLKLISDKLLDRQNNWVPFIDDANKISNKILIASIFYHSKDSSLPFKYCIKMLLEKLTITDLTCSCGELKALHQSKLMKTCKNNVCRRQHLSLQSKTRESYKNFLTDSARDKKSKSLTGRVFTEEHKQNIKHAKKQQWTEEYKQQDKKMRIEKGTYKKAADTLKLKIQKGEYTPVNNRSRAKRITSNTNNVSYRSKWEEKFHNTHPHLLFEYTRIPYSFNGKNHIYITDFTDVNERVIYEIKPKSFLLSDITRAKEYAAIEWCALNSYTYKIITEDDFNFYEE